MKNITLLDCSLRDGSHLTNGNFGSQMIKNVIKDLISTKIDIIEIGFISNEPTGEGIAKFQSLEEVNKVVPVNRSKSKISLMADRVDISEFDENDGSVDYIRVSFKKQYIEWAYAAVETLTKKGYKCCVNPIYGNTYSDSELINLIQKFNKLNFECFTIVDTFGVMRTRDVSRMYSIIDHNLNENTGIGIHLHENMGLAFSMAQHIISISNPNRELIVDGSLYGMGRVPGNLCIEQMMDYVNYEYGPRYDVGPAYDAIDEYISPIKKKTEWGYLIPYYISGKFGLHRMYAEYLINKGKLRTRDIQNILCSVDQSEAELFNEDYIESKYREYLEYSVARNDLNALITEMKQINTVAILGPGSSLNDNKERIIERLQTSNATIISINFNPDFINPDKIFCTNIKRFENLSLNKYYEKLIITSNVAIEGNNARYILHYKDLAYSGNYYCDNSMVMLIHLIQLCGIKNVILAGCDGIFNGETNFYEGITSGSGNFATDNNYVKKILKENYTDINIDSVTPTAYMDD